MKKAIFLFLILSAVACKKSPKFMKISGETMGTLYHITYLGTVEKQQIDSVLADFSKVFSTYDSKSFLSRINEAKDSNKTFELGRKYAHYYPVLESLHPLHRQTLKAFNPFSGSLYNAWGFSEKGELIIDDLDIESLVLESDANHFKIEKGSVKKLHPEAKINVNAVAKGFGVDVIAKYLEANGVKNYLIEIGGEVRCKGLSPEGKTWTLGIKKPEKGSENIIASVQLDNKSMATSGNYENYKMHGDSMIGHTIDPRTGYPSKSRVLSASVFANDCMTADAFATACMVLDEGISIKLIEETPNVDVYLVYTDYISGEVRSYTSLGIRNQLQEMNAVLESLSMELDSTTN